uniref:PARP catalytic domain-containing protein n=1 Tax=Amphimedon queenslandica TaxID=400682 RepID=A0A1X7UEH0_AMPQE
GAEGIAKTGYDEKKWAAIIHGKGHYSTPDINVAADEMYAASFPFGDKNYQAVMQNRVNLENTSIIPEEKTYAGAEYYVTPSADDLRAYGICIREV